MTPAPRTHRPGRRHRVALTAALLTTLLVVTDQSGALADPSPTPPSAADVQNAQAAVQAAQGSVAQMEVRLAELSVVGDQTDVAVQVAGEKYTQALADAQAAQSTADDAAQRSTQAAADAESARRDLVALAREMARSGGGADLLEAVLSADGFQDVARRTATLTQLTGKADDTVQRYRAATLVADTLRDNATAAASRASAAKDGAQQALTAAQQASNDAQAQIAAASAERDQLINALAVAQQTSVAVERARQDALDAQRQQRENAAAEAARLAAAPPPPAAPPVTTAPPRSTAPPATTPPVSPPTTAGSGGTGTTTPVTTPPVSTTPPVTTAPPVSTPPVSTPPPTTSDRYGLGTGVSRGSAAQGQSAVSWAEAQVGKPYIWGGVGPDGFDCSGLTMKAWLAAGVSINRTAADQYMQILKISYSSMRPGDLIFWATDTTDASSIYHVAMFIGGGQMVEAARPGVPIRVTAVRWSGTMPFAGRP